MAFDYKKEYKEFYLPPKKPGLVDVPEMNYIAVRRKGKKGLLFCPPKRKWDFFRTLNI